MRDTFIQTLTTLAKKDPRILLITGDLGFGVLDDYMQTLPTQFLNAGIAEQNMTGLATGLALEGHVVFTYSIANFPVIRCLEQIRNDACYHDANVNIVAIGGGFSYGAAGMSHHATEDIAIMRSMPITIIAPGDLWETEQAVQAIISEPGCCYLRLDKSCAETSLNTQHTFQLGKARRIREGNTLTLISTGGILSETLAAADNLETSGISTRVISMHTIKPLDEDEIRAAVEETDVLITVEEHTVNGGLGGAVAEFCLENRLIPKAFHRIGLRTGFSSIVGSQQYLRHHYQVDKEAIIAISKKALCTI